MLLHCTPFVFRWVVASFIKWRNSVEVQEALEPLSVVLAMAMGFHGRLGKESALLPLTYVEVGSLVLRKMIHFVAKRLGWRLVRTRDELTREADAMDEVDPAEGDVNNMNNHLQEAKSAFLLYDKVKSVHVQTVFVPHLSTVLKTVLFSISRMEGGQLTPVNCARPWLLPTWK